MGYMGYCEADLSQAERQSPVMSPMPTPFQSLRNPRQRVCLVSESSFQVRIGSHIRHSHPTRLPASRSNAGADPVSRGPAIAANNQAASPSMDRLNGLGCLLCGPALGPDDAHAVISLHARPNYEPKPAFQ